MPGDIAGAGHILELQWDELHTVWELQNPASGILPVVLTRQTVNDALAYVPYDSSNPSGLVTASGSCN